MKLVAINWQPADRQLKQFGLVALGALPFLGWLWGAERQLILILALIGAGLAALAFVSPRAVKPIFLGLTLLTLPIGMVVGELFLLLLYYVVFLPTGMIFRLLGRDALQRNLDPAAPTYWQPKAQPTGPASYFHQF